MNKFFGTFLRSIALWVVTGPLGVFVAVFLIGSAWQWGVFGGWVFAMVLAAINGGRSTGGAEAVPSSDTEPGGLFHHDSSHVNDPFHDQTNVLSPFHPNNSVSSGD